MTTFNTTIDSDKYVVNEALKGFTLYKKASSMIAFIGTNLATKTLFIQFNNGKCFTYDCSQNEDILTDMPVIASAGKFFHSEIKGKIAATEIADNCITIAPAIKQPAESYYTPPGVDPLGDDKDGDEFFGAEL